MIRQHAYDEVRSDENCQRLGEEQLALGINGIKSTCVMGGFEDASKLMSE